VPGAVGKRARARHFRPIIAVDALTDVLRQTVLFLNERTALPRVRMAAGRARTAR
jgi:hypothetical protein